MSDRIEFNRTKQGSLVENWLYDLTGPVDTEPVWSKVSRECHMISDGLSKGITEKINEVVKNPGDLAVKAGAGALIAAPVSAALHLTPPPFCFLPEAVTVASSLTLMSDGMNRAKAFGAAVEDYWKYPQNKDKDTQIVAKTGAPLIVDSLAVILGYRQGSIRGTDFLLGTSHTLNYWVKRRNLMRREKDQWKLPDV